jgi:Protein of unknown function (DUF1064)
VEQSGYVSRSPKEKDNGYAGNATHLWSTWISGPEPRRQLIMHYVQYKWGKAKKTVVNGTKYDSKFEASQAQALELLKSAGQIKGFEAHKSIALIVNGYHVADYKIDFAIEHLDGTLEYLETKGFPDRVWVLKWKILEAMTATDPNIRLTLVQQKKLRMRRIRPQLGC